MQHKNRRENIETQLKSVITSTTKYRDAFENLNSLISKTDSDFLFSFATTTQHIESLLDSEDKGLLRPVINQNIPFYINKDVEKEIMSLGAIGGGLMPTDLDYSPSGSQGSLMELFWQLPEHCGKLSRFQIEYDQMNVERRSSGMVVEQDDMVYTQSEPQFCEVPGNKLNAYMDYLCPGYSYQFRIRSANDAGWGMWSKPIVGKCEGFPFTMEYTKNIHRVVIPTSSYYRITVKGAKAEDGMLRHGGKGAIISAVFCLKAGDVLIFLCGGMSSRHHYHSGGGGGSFLALNEVSQSNLLIAAGGGGGTRGASIEDFDGLDASIYPDGRDGVGEDAGLGGVNGAPGEDARDKISEGPSFGNGGAGFMQDSSTARSFLSGGHAGQNGGFGGGGAVGMYGGGGGGGYSGGGGGRGGGGGGSYVISTALDVSREVGNDKHGSMTIDKVMPPYPISGMFQAQISSLSDVTSASDGTEGSTNCQQPVYSFSQVSSSSVGNVSNMTSSQSSKALSTSSVSTSIGTIPESSRESPAGTSQMLDQAKYVSSAATFSVGSDSHSSNGNGRFTVDGGEGEGISSSILSKVDVPLPHCPRVPVSVTPDILNDFLGSSQIPATAAVSSLGAAHSGSNAGVGTMVAPQVPVSEVATMVSTNALGTFMDSKNLIQFQPQDFLRETPDLPPMMNKVSSEEKALIVQQLIQQQQASNVNQSLSQVMLASTESNANAPSLKTPSNVIYQQKQQRQVGAVTSSPMRPLLTTTSSSGGMAGSMFPDQPVAPQSQWPTQHMLGQEHYQQQQLAEMQRFLQSQQQKLQQQQASQQVLQQHVVQGGGQDDLSPPLTQHVVMQQQPAGQPQVAQSLAELTNSIPLTQPPSAQLVNMHQPAASQQGQPQQLLQQLQMPAEVCGDHSPPHLTQQQQHQASQPSSQPSNNGVDHGVPGQYGQQPSFDYSAHQNWNSKN